jgi:hypothetical protein
VEVLDRPGRRAVVLVSRDELVLMEFEMEPETDGAGPHIHPRHVGPGELVHAPPAAVHSFKNSSRARLRLLNIHTPGMRFDEYIQKMDAGEDVDPAEYDVVEVD